MKRKIQERNCERNKEKVMGKGYFDLNYEMFFEPEGGGINTPREFTEELFAWAKREQKEITVLAEGMEPEIELDGKHYVCRLGNPGLAGQNNPVRKTLKLPGTESVVGRWLGYKWVFLYEIEG